EADEPALEDALGGGDAQLDVATLALRGRAAVSELGHRPASFSSASRTALYSSSVWPSARATARSLSVRAERAWSGSPSITRPPLRIVGALPVKASKAAMS